MTNKELDALDIITGFTTAIMGAIIIDVFVNAGGFSGAVGAIAGLFTFILLAVVTLLIIKF